jgi:hypothetical protein
MAVWVSERQRLQGADLLTVDDRGQLGQGLLYLGVVQRCVGQDSLVVTLVFDRPDAEHLKQRPDGRFGLVPGEPAIADATALTDRVIIIRTIPGFA